MRSAKGNELEDPRVWTEEITGVPKGSAAGILGMVAGHAAIAVLEAPAEVANMIRGGARVAQRGLGGGGSAAGATAALLPQRGAESTRLFRAVEPEELKDVLRYGDYNIHPNSTFKRFAFVEADLDAFINANPGRTYTKTFVDLPASKLQFMFEHEDPGGVGRAVGIDVFETPEFYDWFQGPVQIIR